MIEENPHTLTFSIDEITRLNTWLFDVVQPYIKGRTVEIGSGQGFFSSALVAGGIEVYLSDPKKINRDKLRETFKGVLNIKDVYSIDINQSAFESRYKPGMAFFHTVIALNAIEYGYPGQLAMTNLLRMLKPNGFLIVLAPAYTSIYNGLEDNLSDWKIYNQNSLKHLLGNDIDILKTRYLNLISNTNKLSDQQLGLSIVVVARKQSPDITKP